MTDIEKKNLEIGDLRRAIATREVSLEILREKIDSLNKTFSEVNDIFGKRQTILRLALEEIAKDFGTDHCDGNTMIAKKALEDSV